MRCPSLSLRRVLVLINLLLLWTTPFLLWADGDVKQADPPGTAQYMAVLRDWFKKADLNDDGYLNKLELAIAFRGPEAKPPDDPKDKPDGDKPKDSKHKPEPTKYPDQEFLQVLDADGDGQVSRAEFETWARGYAEQLKKQEEALKSIALMEEQLSRAAKSEAHQIESALARERAAMKHLSKELQIFEKQWQHAMKSHRH
jgi:hypothetical protein